MSCQGCDDCGDLTLPEGADGVGIESMSISNGDIVVTYTDGTSENIGGFEDPWVAVTNAELTTRTFSGTDGCTLVGTLAADATIELAYNVLSPNTVAIKGYLAFDITINRAASGFDFGQFTIILTFPACTSTAFFSGNKTFSSPFTAAFNYQDTPVAIDSQGPGEAVYSNGAGRCSFSNTGGTNRIVINCWPNLPNVNANGDYAINLSFNGLTKIS